jgi:hypothetical protein
MLREIAEIKNLMWAWEKAKAFYQPGDIWFDELEVVKFEMNLTNELLQIQADLLAGEYRLKPICPVAFPKSKNPDGPRTRQTFWINVRDQVTWLAVANVIGRDLDSRMPFWSYGNRLHISMFYELNSKTHKNELRFGDYRNTSKNTYRKWSQSWPLYRRHINTTTKFLSAKKFKNLKNLDENEAEILRLNDSIEYGHPLKVQYLEKSYWTEEATGELFWAAVDLEKFYPKLNVEVIKENLKTYLPYNDEQLENTLSSLLRFEIDSSEWTKKELEVIDLDPHLFHGLPTGLFVAGFLSNVAMMKIDSLINEKLQNNKSIAHFRYVDDHVILATSFSDLVTWIEEYRDLLKSQSIGTSINPSKTQPKHLGDYFEALENQKKDAEELLQGAKDSSKLDPDFPSPLMTQTLAKVSKIAGTTFQLLGPEEEKNLIADVEHLLVTEFPDHELRKDTRIAFAARVLSTVVPLMNIDMDSFYQANRQYSQAVASFKEAYKKKRPGDEYEDRMIEYFNICEKEGKLVRHIEEKLANRTMKLLLKSIRENHEKVRLWSRIIEFCSKSESSRIETVLKEVRSLESRKETNDLSISFIHSLILQVLTQLLFKSLRVLNSEGTTTKQRKRASAFISDVVSDSVLKYFEKQIKRRSKRYEKSSLEVFKFCCGTIIYSLDRGDKTLVRKYQLIDWNHPGSFFEGSTYPFEVWVWWFYDLLPMQWSEEPYLWGIISSRINADNTLGQVLIQRHPKKLSTHLLEEIEKNKSVFEKNEGWIFDVYQSLKKRNMDTQHSFLNKITRKEPELKEFVSLYQWVEWTSDYETRMLKSSNNQMVFDPRLGEWMALEIVRQSIEAIQEKEDASIFSIDEPYHKNIHPNNFKLPKNWIEEKKFTWADLEGLDKKISLRSKEDLITDERFFPPARGQWWEENRLESALNAFGALLICLLAKNCDLPGKWHPLGHQQVWLGLAKSKLKYVAVSSITKDIIDGCFSKRNQETARLRLFKAERGEDIVDDNSFDPPSFQDLRALLRYIEFSQAKLKSQQISVTDHQPRQLIPIHLKQLRRSNYQEEIGE